MSQAEDDYTRVERPGEIEALLGALMEPGGASLQLTGSGGKPLPVLVVEQRPGEALLLDISAIREVAMELRHGGAFRLLGQAEGKIVRTPALEAQACQEEGGQLICRCPYPHHLEVLQRRDSFRARLRLGMEVGGILRDEHGNTAQGDLRDLSLEGCRMELPLAASGLLAESIEAVELEFCFPNDTRFIARASPRHQRVDTERQSLQVGFRFERPSADQERQLWYLVREIERESARYEEGGEVSRLPSLLFQASTATPPSVGRRNSQQHATPMARRLARIAGYLDAQALELKQGGEIDSVQLSRHADRLLLLHDEEREALLFATRCLHREPLLVRHSLSVAVKLVDLAGMATIPRDLCKAMVACAMVHDLGKILLPAGLLDKTSFTAADRDTLRTHVAMLLGRLHGCHWLSRNVITSVVQDINERLDGSGYPRGLAGDRLHELSRAAAVVDAIEAMRRARPDRDAWRIDAIYRYLLGQPERFDTAWVKRYIKHFGLYPIGSLVRFESGSLGWVLGLDGRGRPSRVRLADAVEPPSGALGELLQGEAIQRLGEICEEIPVST